MDKVTQSFLLGIATGAALGILLAPASGKDTRQRIKEEADKLIEEAMALKAKQILQEA